MTNWTRAMAHGARVHYVRKQLVKGTAALSLCVVMLAAGTWSYTEQQRQNDALYRFIEAQVDGLTAAVYADFDEDAMLYWEF